MVPKQVLQPAWRHVSCLRTAGVRSECVHSGAFHNGVYDRHEGALPPGSIGDRSVVSLTAVLLKRSRANCEPRQSERQDQAGEHRFHIVYHDRSYGIISMRRRSA